MTFRAQFKQLTMSEGENNTLPYCTYMCVVFYYILYAYYTAKFYLIYFETDETVSIAKESSIVESKEKLTIGNKCHVKHGRNVIEGLVVTHGKSPIHVLRVLNVC